MQATQGRTAPLAEPLGPFKMHDPGTDIRAVLDGYVSISPLDTAMVHEAHTLELADINGSLASHLASQA